MVVTTVLSLLFGVGILLMLPIVVLGGGVDLLVHIVVVALIASLVLTLAYYIGFWKVTPPEPSPMVPESWFSARRLFRFVLAAIPYTTIATIVTALASIQSSDPDRLEAGLFVLALIDMPLKILAILLFFQYARTVAERLPDRDLAESTTVCMYGLVSLSIVGTGIVIVMRLDSPLSNAGARVAASQGAAITGLAFGAIVGIASIVFQVWAIVLLFRFRQSLRKAAGDAVTRWFAARNARNVPVAAQVAQHA